MAKFNAYDTDLQNVIAEAIDLMKTFSDVFPDASEWKTKKQFKVLKLYPRIEGIVCCNDDDYVVIRFSDDQVMCAHPKDVNLLFQKVRATLAVNHIMRYKVDQTNVIPFTLVPSTITKGVDRIMSTTLSDLYRGHPMRWFPTLGKIFFCVFFYINIFVEQLQFVHLNK